MGWVSPTGHVANGWSSPEYAYDGNTATYASIAVARNTWSAYLELNRAAISCNKVQMWYSRAGTRINNVEVDIYNGGWINIYAGTPIFGQWHEIPFSVQNVSALRIRMYSNAQADTARTHEGQFWEVTVSPKSTQYLNGNDCPVFPHEKDLQSDKLPCAPPYD